MPRAFVKILPNRACKPIQSGNAFSFASRRQYNFLHLLNVILRINQVEEIEAVSSPVAHVQNLLLLVNEAGLASGRVDLHTLRIADPDFPALHHRKISGIDGNILITRIGPYFQGVAKLAQDN